MEDPGYGSGRLTGRLGIITQRSQVQIMSPLLRARPSRLFVAAFRLSAVVPYGAAYPIGAMMSCEKTTSKPALGRINQSMARLPQGGGLLPQHDRHAPMPDVRIVEGA